MIRVVKPGLLTTVQDRGRTGYRAFGMPVAGAMDARSLACANLLARNAPDLAALELTLAGPTLQFERAAFAGVCGAEMKATLDGNPVANGTGFPVAAGSVLAFGFAAAGCRAYLAVHGGIDVPVVLGSRSTYTRASVGGHQGRALRAGDLLAIGRATVEPVPCALPPERVPRFGHDLAIRVMLGPQDDRFLEEGIRTFLGSPYTVSNRNDRMGYQLEGPPIRHRDQADIVSDALCAGAIQVPGRGIPIVMMADCQTTGGYAKIATVITTDLPLMAQARVGDTVTFRAAQEEEAVAAAREERQLLDDLAELLAGPRRARRRR